MKKYNRYLKECIAAAVLFLAVPAPVFAEVADRADKCLFIGPRATYSTPKDANRGQLDGGVQARCHLSPGFGLEGSVDYRSEAYFDLTTIKTYPVQASLLAYLSAEGVIKPFLLGGVGWYFTQVNGPFGFSHTDSRFGLHAGAGLEFMLNDVVSVDGSCRYVWLESVASKDANGLSKTYQDGGSMITLAVTFLY